MRPSTSTQPFYQTPIFETQKRRAILSDGRLYPAGHETQKIGVGALSLNHGSAYMVNSERCVDVLMWRAAVVEFRDIRRSIRKHSLKQCFHFAVVTVNVLQMFMTSRICMYVE